MEQTAASGIAILCSDEEVLKNTIGKEEKEQARASALLLLLAASRVCRRAGRTVTPTRPGVPRQPPGAGSREASKAKTESMDPGARAGPGLAPRTILRPDSSSPGAIYPRRVGAERAEPIGAADHEIVLFSAISAPFGLEMRESSSLYHAQGPQRHHEQDGSVSGGAWGSADERRRARCSPPS